MRIYIHLGHTPTMYRKKTSAALLKVRKSGKARKLNRLELRQAQEQYNQSINLKGN